jgi:adenosine deaminase
MLVIFSSSRALSRAVCLLIVMAMAMAVQARAAESQVTTATIPRARAATAAERRVSARLDSIRHDPPALRAFLQALPKGADLHTHLSGAVYAESYIRWAADLPMCIDTSTFAYVEAKGSCNDAAGQRPAAAVLQDPLLYRHAVDALSTRRWREEHAVGHDAFFDAFLKFRAVIRDGRDLSTAIVARSIADVVQRAALQNVQHLELIASLDFPVEVSSADSRWDTDEQFPLLRQRLLDGGLRDRVRERQRWLDAVETQARAALACGTPSPMRGCDTSFRFIASASRSQAPDQVFAQAMFDFELAAADPRVAGVNLVAPEDSFLSMRDYDLHMRMFRFFRQSYPDVHVTLHAGELSFGLVPPEQLGRHVPQAVDIGGAQRIGHGTDVMYAADPSAVLRMMAQRRIAVEISLTSSDVILGVRGPSHPIRHYLRAGVPVAIATDDEGVARSDLTNEYQRAVEEQGLSYRQLKEISRNSLEYSFLPAQEKARLRRQLDEAFVRFEAQRR